MSTERTSAGQVPVRGLAGLLALTTLTTTALAQGKDVSVDFAHSIAPLIKAHCAKCHTNGTYKGSFSLDTRESMLKSEAVSPARAAESELIDRVTSDDPEFRMPPRRTDRSLPTRSSGSERGSTRGRPGSRASASRGGATSPR